MKQLAKPAEDFRRMGRLFAAFAKLFPAGRDEAVKQTEELV